MPRAVQGSTGVDLSREGDCVNASVESVEVVQGERVQAVLECHVPGLDPQPFALPLTAEQIRQLLAVDDEVEGAGASAIVPWRGPVLGTHPDAVLAARRLERLLRVSNWFAHAVGEEIGRTHLVHELGVVDPSTIVLKPLRLDDNRLRLRGKCSDKPKKQQ